MPLFPEYMLELLNMAVFTYVVVVKANKATQRSYSLSSDSEDEYYSCQSLPSVSRESDNLASEDGPNSQVTEIVINNSDANDNYKMGLL